MSMSRHPGFPLALQPCVTLLFLAAGVSVVSALQFRSVLLSLGKKEIPRGYWTSLGVWLNFLLVAVVPMLAMHFVTSS
jgi:putative membrane protein